MTPETLSEVAGQAELGPIDEKTALIIQVCETKAKAQFQKELFDVREKHLSLRERHIAILRELRERFTALGFDDFLKILIGIIGGFLIREISGTGIDGFKNPLVLLCAILLLIGLVFLMVRHINARGRRSEVIEELQRMRSEDQV